MEYQEYGSTTQILGFVANKVALGGVIDSKGIDANSFGKKIIPAGTPVGGAASFLANEQEVLLVANDATAQGILEHDVDVTSGKGNGTVIIEGYINEFRLPAGVTISDEAKTALKDVKFFKRNE